MARSSAKRVRARVRARCSDTKETPHRHATPHARIADLQLPRALVALTPLPRTLS